MGDRQLRCCIIDTSDVNITKIFTVNQISMQELSDIISWENFEHHLPLDLLQEYQESFQIMDRRSTGKISTQELLFVFSSINIHLTQQQIKYYANEVFSIDFINNDDRIFEFYHFVGLIVAITTECVSSEDFMSVFKEFDKDKDGFITKDDLKSLLMRLGDDITDDDIIDMISEADRDGDGMVSMEDFMEVMRVTTGVDAPQIDPPEDIFIKSKQTTQSRNKNCNKTNRKFSVLSLFSNDGCNLEVLETILKPENIKHQKNILKRAKVFLKAQFRKRFCKALKN